MVKDSSSPSCSQEPCPPSPTISSSRQDGPWLHPDMPIGRQAGRRQQGPNCSHPVQATLPDLHIAHCFSTIATRLLFPSVKHRRRTWLPPSVAQKASTGRPGCGHHRSRPSSSAGAISFFNCPNSCLPRSAALKGEGTRKAGPRVQDGNDRERMVAWARKKCSLKVCVLGYATQSPAFFLPSDPFSFVGGGESSSDSVAIAESVQSRTILSAIGGRLCRSTAPKGSPF